MEREIIHSFMYDHWYLGILAVEAVLIIIELIGVVHDYKKYKYNWHMENKSGSL